MGPNPCQSRVYAGSLNEGEDSWLSTFTGQMLREGAAGRSAADIAEAAAGMGGNLGIGSDEHETAIGLNVLSANAADAVRLVGDVALRPTFAASEFGRSARSLAHPPVAKSSGRVADAALATPIMERPNTHGRP